MTEPEKIDIVQVFEQAAFAVHGRRLEGVTLDSKFSELAMDSVAVMETLGAFEDRVGVRFADEDLARVTCLRDLEGLVARARRGA